MKKTSPEKIPDLKSDSMSMKSPMNISPTPKEKKPFQFFRSRTLSSSSTESNGGNNLSTGSNPSTTSPRNSTRNFLDRVRKRSNSDVKASNSVDKIDGSLNQYHQSLQKHLQEQLFKDQQKLARKQATDDNQSPTAQVKMVNGYAVNISRQRPHLSHSISEECDDVNNDAPDEVESFSKTYNGSKSDAMKINFPNNRPSPIKHKIDNIDSDLESQTDINSIENNQIFSYFMKHKFCYDIMPKSAKVVVFDTQLLVKKAFFALIYNGVRSAPLWDSKNQKFIGMLTITDFILILQKYYREANAKIEELEEHKLETWREVLKEYSRPFIYLRPQDSLFEAIRVLCSNKVHRLPIIDPVSGNVVCIVTHKRILRYLYLFIYDMPQPDFLQKSISDLKLGTYENIKTIVKETPLTEALNIFVSSRVSALPVVDENGKLVNIYSKFDVIDLAAEKTYTNLDVTVIEALKYRNSRFDGVASCTKDELLVTIMERIVKKEVHRLVIVDEQNRVTGIVSLSDILTFIVLKQEALMKNTASLTQAFGLTRLSSSSVDHVNMNNTGSDQKLNNRSSGGSSIDNLNDSSGSSLNSCGSSPIANVQQPQSSSIDQAIFEDDPMEVIETVK